MGIGLAHAYEVSHRKDFPTITLGSRIIVTLKRAIRDNRGIPVDHNGDYTVADWCRLWFETYSKPNISYNTAKPYENIIEQHIIPAIGAVKLKQLTSIHIQRMYNESKTNGRVQRFEKQQYPALSNGFVRRIHMVLHSALQQAVKERIIPYNPCDNCRIPPKEKKDFKYSGFVMKWKSVLAL